jgi:hypothetical protein
VAEFPPAIILHDPVVEAVIRNDVNRRDRHVLPFRSARKMKASVASSS